MRWFLGGVLILCVLGFGGCANTPRGRMQCWLDLGDPADKSEVVVVTCDQVEDE